MPNTFEPAVVSAVLGHMNADHHDDNLLIARAFGPSRDITGARMSGFDGNGGEWETTDATGTTSAVVVAWLAGPISERAEVRREIVALYDAACERLGVAPRAHS